MKHKYPAMLGLWMVSLILCSAASEPEAAAAAGGAPAQLNLLAKVSDTHCVGNSETVRTAVAGKPAVITLSAVTINKVQSAAAAVGLTYLQDLQFACLVKLGPAQTKAATDAAVKALLAPSPEAGAETASATAAGVQFDFIEEDLPKYRTGSSQTGITLSPLPATKAASLRALFNTGPVPVDVLYQHLGRNATHPRHNRNHTQTHNHTRPVHSPKPRHSPHPKAGGGAQSLKRPEGIPADCPNGVCGLWGINRIKAPDTWAALGSRIPFAQIQRRATIIDDGVDPANFDLAKSIDKASSRTYSTVSGNAPANGLEPSGASHGSHVSGTAAGDWLPYNGQNDPNGIVGVAGPQSNTLVSCNVFGAGDSAYDSDIIRCIGYAVSIKTHYAINLSLGGVGTIGSDKAYRTAFQAFCDAGGVALIAAGNGETVNGSGGKSRPVDVENAGGAQDKTQAEYPAYMAKYFPGCVLAVAASTNSPMDKLASFSNYGQLVKIAAPGVNIKSDVNTNGGGWATETWSGTSMATPHVTGAVILLRNAFPEASNKQVVDCITSSADMSVTSNTYGTIAGGVLNVKAAYDCLTQMFGGGGGGGGGGTPTVDCKAQSVPVCVNTALGAPVSSCVMSTSTYCLTVGSTTCSYPYKDSGYTCSSSGTKCSGNRADCPATPTMDCTKQVVPACVDVSTGVATNGCVSQPGQYCVAVSGLSCTYQVLGSSFTCDSLGNTCDGKSPDCPASSGGGGGGGGTCVDPPAVDGATWDSSCSNGAASGGSCAATCDSGYSGDGYTVNCNSDGTWSDPYGGGCTAGGSSTTCDDCSANQLCLEEDGCYCKSSSASEVCTCAEDLGFTSYTYTDDTGAEKSVCGWALDFVAGTYVKANKNTKLKLDFTVGASGNEQCAFDYVVDSVDYGTTLYDCPTDGSYVALARSTRWLGSETCSSRSKSTTYVMSSGRPPARSRGKCLDVYINTSDSLSHVLTMKYNN